MRYLYNDPSRKLLRQGLRNKSTECEIKLWRILRERMVHGLKFRRQYGIGPYVLDFYCPAIRLAIEVDGGHHFITTQRKHDLARTHFLVSYNIMVFRVTNDEVTTNMEGVMMRLEAICATRTTPRPLL